MYRGGKGVKDEEGGVLRKKKKKKKKGGVGRGEKKDKISPAFSSSAMSCLDCLPLAAALSPLSGPEGRSPITGKSAAANEVSLNQRVQSQGGRRGTAVGCQLTPRRTGKPSRQLQACPKKKKKKGQKKEKSLHKSSRPVFSHLVLSDTGVRVSSAHFKAL